jgi:hypothetical protein
MKLQVLPSIALAAILLQFSTLSAASPYDSNNGLYPAVDGSPSGWGGSFRISNFDYPAKAEKSKWLAQTSGKPLTVATAPAYVRALKKYLEPAMRDMIEKPNEWSSKKVGWYDMPWQAEGGPKDGREAILGSYSGQILPAGAFKDLNIPLQNFTVIYYDALSATMLKKLWANPYNPNRNEVNFPEGAMVVKAAAVSPTPKQWDVVSGSTVWNVFRPSVADLTNPAITDPKPQVLDVRVMQFDIIVKDRKASPQTGWVFTTFVYNKDAVTTNGRSGTWDKLVPLGAMWGNDPDVADQVGKNKGGASDPKLLKETWINREESAPYALEQLGWGGRLSGPIDVSKRHKVIYTDGSVPRPEQRASSCLSCHGTAQYPFVANLYPSPNRIFPKDGSPFLMYPPGSSDWNKWFKNKSGSEPQNKTAGAVALDYDMLVMFALGAFDAASGSDRYMQKNKIRGH